MKKSLLALSATLLLVGTAHADGIDGQALYKDNCSKCHGDNGMAHTTRGYIYFARNFTSAKWQASRSDEDIYNTISNGPGWWSVMPVFKKTLSEDERRALVKVVRGFAPPIQ
jgi:mono/diheme cytochrome c family protein